MTTDCAPATNWPLNNSIGGAAVITLSPQGPQGETNIPAHPVWHLNYSHHLSPSQEPLLLMLCWATLLMYFLCSEQLRCMPTEASSSWQPVVLTDHQVRSWIKLNMILEDSTEVTKGKLRERITDRLSLYLWKSEIFLSFEIFLLFALWH